MPSKAHQWLVLWTARKMIHDGFLIGGYDGPTPQGGVLNLIPRPFELNGVRPDVWGASIHRPSDLALGEAKTADDIDTDHTREQLGTFSRVTKRRCRRLPKLYLAIPHSCAYQLDRVLIDLRLIAEKRVVRIHVPDCLLLETRL